MQLLLLIPKTVYREYENDELYSAYDERNHTYKVGRHYCFISQDLLYHFPHSVR